METALTVLAAVVAWISQIVCGLDSWFHQPAANWSPIGIFIFAAGVIYMSFFEYVLHRWLMHELRGFVRQKHLLNHHAIFRAERYRASRSEDREAILFGWWLGPLILASHLPALWALGAFTGWPVLWPGLLAIATYYLVYEYLHWCMHNPADRVVERTALFRFLDRNHQLHHTHSRINFNVLLPLGDLVFGTLQRSTRSPGGDHSRSRLLPKYIAHIFKAPIANSLVNRSFPKPRKLLKLRSK